VCTAPTACNACTVCCTAYKTSSLSDLSFGHGILQRVSRLPHGLQDEIAVRSELGRGILQCAFQVARSLPYGL
jgi:coenzyme F420-reducing hydrogenase beta subunit